MNWTKVGYVSVISGVASLAVGTWLYWRADNYHVQPVDVADLMNGIIERQKALATAYSTAIQTSVVVSTEWATDTTNTYLVWDTGAGTWTTTNYLYETTVTNTVVWTNVTETMPVTRLSIVGNHSTIVGRYIVAITNAVYTNDTVVTTNWWTNDAAVCQTTLTTNAIDWHKPTAAMVSNMQAEIMELIPHYYNTASLSGGTNDAGWAAPWTVTGLFASVNIGDGVSKFTRTPAIGTTPAQYGDPDNHIYPVTLIEMYKALYALRVLVSPTSGTYACKSYHLRRGDADWIELDTWNDVVYEAGWSYTNSPLTDTISTGSVQMKAGTWGALVTPTYDTTPVARFARIWGSKFRFEHTLPAAVTSTEFNVSLYMDIEALEPEWADPPNRGTFDDQDSGVVAGWSLVSSYSGTGNVICSDWIGPLDALSNKSYTWCSEPSLSSPSSRYAWEGGTVYSNYVETLGWQENRSLAVIEIDFDYCNQSIP